MNFMNKTYKASEIVKRAKQLADIANTDFISFEEDTAYLNDAFTQVFNKIVDKGDKQFIKEVELACNGAFGTYTEYALPNDCYQIVSLKNKYTGALVERHAESQGINSGTYDVINNRLRLYGVADSNLVLTYWTIPKFLSFPKPAEPYDIEDFTAVAGTNYFSAGNAVYKPMIGDIYNIKTKEKIGRYINQGTVIAIGNGIIIDRVGTNYKIVNFDGTTPLGVTTSYPVATYVLSIDEFFNISFEEKANWHDNTLYLLQLDDNVLEFRKTGDIITISINGGTEIDISETNKWLSSSFRPFPIGKFDDNDAFIIGDILYATDGVDLYAEKIKHRNPQILAVTDSGFLTTNYNVSPLIESWVPDTLLNFPKEIYFSLLSAQLGLMYLSKNNGESSGLADLYQNYWNTFMDSLSQAGAYTRIKNVYGARF